ncbi:MAG: hypothetical protein JO118_16185 [Acetobacteraceae bacterium]|nr:hypothetical protein [Acetobacteraceae bacterium]
MVSQQNFARVFLQLSIAPGLWLGVAAPAVAGGEPVQFSATHTYKLDEHHALPVGGSPDHALGLVKSSGVNRSTGKTPFLDGATETEVLYYEAVKGAGPHHGFILYKAADGTMLNEFNGYGTSIVADGKPWVVGAGSWHTVSGTGRYANGAGVGTYSSKIDPSNFEGATDWQGTFVEGGKQ